ncbi:hypothetical protein ABK040_012243 [Willaertia magna]
MTEPAKTIPLLFEQSLITEFDNTQETHIHYPKDFSYKFQQFSNISEFMFIFGKTDYKDKDGSVLLFNLTNFKIKKIVTGEKFCILLTNDGKCYVFGNLTSGPRKINLSDKFKLPLPFKKPTLIDWTVNDPIEDVFAHTYVCFLTKKGELYFFNLNQKDIVNGKLDPQHYNYEKIKSIDLGNENILILTENNNIYGYGSNYKGQLGFQEDGKCYACGDPTYAANGQLQPESDNTHIFKLIPNLQDEFIENVITGLFFVALKAKSGKYFVFGDNKFNQFGKSDTIKERIRGPTLLNTFNNNEIEEIECGGYHSIITTKNKELFITGMNVKLPFYPNTQLGFTNLNLRNYFNHKAFDLNSNYELKAGMGRYFYTVYALNKYPSRRWNFRRSIKLNDIEFVFTNCNTNGITESEFMDDYL